MQKKDHALKHQFFDQKAKGWEDRNYPPEVRARLTPMIEKLHLQPATHILDVGCGEGVLVPYLQAVLGNNGQIIELDPSEVMLQGGLLKAAPNVFYVKAGAESIPLVSQTIDTVVAFACFPHFDNPSEALRELHRVLKDKGEIHILHLLSREQLRQHHAQHFAVERDVLPTHEEMTKLFQEAGFTNIEIEEAPYWYHLYATKG